MMRKLLVRQSLWLLPPFFWLKDVLNLDTNLTEVDGPLVNARELLTMPLNHSRFLESATVVISGVRKNDPGRISMYIVLHCIIIVMFFFFRARLKKMELIRW